MPLYDEPLLGLIGEVGEVVELIKKDRRKGVDQNGMSRRKRLSQGDLASELGDVLWYLTRLANENGLVLADIAQGNLDKLEKRHKEVTD